MSRLPALLGAATLLVPALAMACGGFFCSATPVDQTAERVIFVKEDASTVTSYVEITYQGEAEDFAWIVPVPAVPELDIWDGGAFNALDLATQPQFQGNFGCFFEDADGGQQPGPPNAGGGDPGVDVLAREQVGPFDTVTITSDDPRALVQWLRDNGFRILPEMEPFVALYTAEGMKFVAMKLQPGEGVDAIAPISMRYASAGMAVPLRLTAVAAQLEMGVKVWILGDKRYGVTNMPAIEIDDADLRWDDWAWQSNYVPLVARAVDAAGGHGFITELAAPTAPLAQRVREGFVPDRAGQAGLDSRDALAELLERKPYITRLYTRVSPEEMDIDPLFEATGGPDFDGIRVIPDNDQDACGGGNEDFDACAFAACGAAGACAEVGEDGQRAQPGCACADGALARAALDANAPGGITVACGDARMNFMQPIDPNAINPVDPDPLLQTSQACAGNPCGAMGECVVLNGFQSCACQPGAVAIGKTNESGQPQATCVAPKSAPQVDPATIELRQPNLPYPGRPEADPIMPVVPGNGGVGMAAAKRGGCSASGGAPDGDGWWLMLPLAALGLRRRR